MRIFKTRAFHKWAIKTGLNDLALLTAVHEIEYGLVDADLGGHVIKKRVSLAQRGKRSGARTVLVYQAHHQAFFIYGFAKNARSNILPDELKALKQLAIELLNYSEHALGLAIEHGALIEVEDDE
ncbi:hypothetical protein VA7868_02276 [Vibrio aerogenes CECT 7868]|uniref:Toxin HigB-2 n=1 Tax=Vibrio aerogenes CECT 7868 TaxID=1216006 RepID=A0A1M5Z4D6_9VIBR|nr:type II toxin-antitoxin system RelE/ParE family toxin [Vibrio aerogenes]SHI19079.1 hypothetical protein VA7868_02276 [Vibrio aerogenes CECT 7868]